MILWLFAVKFRKRVEQESGLHVGPRCLVIDNSVLEKTGKYIEKVSWLWDHAGNRFVLGMKLLLMGY